MAKSIVGELKDLFVKFGGKLADLKGTETTAEMIDAIEQVYEGGGGGGNNDFVVTYTDNDDTLTADKSFAEIQAAFINGKTIKATYNNMYLVLSEAPSEEGGSFKFFCSQAYQNQMMFVEIMHGLSGGADSITSNTMAFTAAE